MKIFVKTLTGKKLAEVDDSLTIKDLKELIEKDHNMPIDTQKLVAKGKILDVPEKTLKDYSLTEGSFIVVMKLQKKPEPANKPVKKEEEVKKEEDPVKPNEATNTANQQSAASSTGQSAQPTAAAINPQPVPTASTQPQVNEEQVQTLMALSQQPRELCIQALQAGGGDPNVAFEILTTGAAIASQGGDPMGQLAAMLAQNNMGGNAAYGDEGEYGDEQVDALADAEGIDDPALEALQEFTDSPQFEAVRARMLEDPNFYNEFMQMLQQQQPQLYAIIQQHPMAFMNLIMGGGINAAAEENILEGHDDGDYNPDDEAEEAEEEGEGEGEEGEGMVVDVTQADNDAIQRLVGITGFPQERVLEAYFACAKNEELAADFLFSNAGLDEDAAMNQALALSNAAVQGQPAQPQPAPQQNNPAAADAQNANPAQAQAPNEQQQQPGGNAPGNQNSSSDQQNNGGGDGSGAGGSGGNQA